MPNTKASGWIFGTAIAALIILIASWFLVISPKLASADEDRAQTTAGLERNRVLQNQLNSLKKQFENLPATKADLAALRKQIPATVHETDFIRTISEFADASGVFTTVFTEQDALPYVAPQGALPAAAPTPTPTPSPTSGAAAAAGAAPTATGAGAAPVAGLVLVPLEITVIGTYQNVTGFLNDLQTKPDRLFLVTEITGNEQRAVAAGGGRPATAEGALELVIKGYLYVLQDTRGVEPIEPAATGSLPVPDPAKNPYVPLAGTSQ